MTCQDQCSGDCDSSPGSHGTTKGDFDSRPYCPTLPETPMPVWGSLPDRGHSMSPHFSGPGFRCPRLLPAISVWCLRAAGSNTALSCKTSTILDFPHVETTANYISSLLAKLRRSRRKQNPFRLFPTERRRVVTQPAPLTWH